jgi:DNA-binding helix-hairpin-helix protein with protein kinase domain
MAAVAMQQPTLTTTGSATYTGSRSGLGYKLGQEIGAGGNGVVYAVSRRPELVAKIQKYALSKHDVDKLDVLVRGATPELLSVAAWPMDVLIASSGQVVGFVMPRILDARPLYELYSPRSRIQHFPTADFRFLVHAAANVARLFAAVHKAGFICGDVNHSNILVRQTGTVAAVDCDSFQVGDGSRFPCLVGTELFVPPELMGTSLGATRRTLNHDNFGLAVLVFHLLFMGRHPFAGRYLGRGDMPIERAIGESRFAYSVDAARTQMAPPPFTPPMTTVGPAVTELFELAFRPQAAKGGRPSPEAWIDALDALKSSLVPCKSVSWHHHPAATTSCPWCAIEGPARIKLFGGVIKIATAAIADLDSLWARYLALVDPGAPRPLPILPAKAHGIWARIRTMASVRPRISLPGLPDARAIIATATQRSFAFGRRLRGNNIFWAACAVYLVAKVYWDDLSALARSLPSTAEDSIAWIKFLPWEAPSIALAATMTLLAGPLLFAVFQLLGRGLFRIFLQAPVARQKSQKIGTRIVAPLTGRRDAQRAWRKAATAWKGQPSPPDVSDLRPPIEAIKLQLDDLAAEREAAIRACATPETEEAQLARYLGGFRIEDAKLANIGSARCAVLRSWGIDTAADIDESKIAEIPGFGKNLTDKLVIWREVKEKSFTPSAAAIIDPHDVQRIDRRLAARRTKLMKELREKIAEVEQRMSDSVKQRNALWARVEAAYQDMLAHG